MQRPAARGTDINNPVLLKVYVGPDYAIVPLKYRILDTQVEDYFVFCYWDQSGSGLAYTLHITDTLIILAQIVDDGLEVATYFKCKFNKDNIY